MKPYLISLGAGLIAGFVYSLLGVRSPAPPVIALIGLSGILLGEQVMPIARRLTDRVELTRFICKDSARHMLGHLPTNRDTLI